MYYSLFDVARSLAHTVNTRQIAYYTVQSESDRGIVVIIVFSGGAELKLTASTSQWAHFTSQIADENHPG